MCNLKNCKPSRIESIIKIKTLSSFMYQIQWLSKLCSKHVLSAGVRHTELHIDVPDHMQSVSYTNSRLDCVSCAPVRPSQY